MASKHVAFAVVMCGLTWQAAGDTGPSGSGGPAIGTGAETANCFFDTAQASTYLSQAGIAIDAGTRQCVKETFETTAKGEAGCAADVGEILKSFAFTASFLSSAINSCGIVNRGRERPTAQCAADITGLLGAVGALTDGASGIEAHCNPNGVGPHVAPNLDAPPDTLTPLGQTKTQRSHAATTAFCTVYVMQSTWFLARAGLNINAATSNCQTGSQAACASSVSGTLGAISAATSYIAGAAATCSHGVKVPGAACAAMVSMVTAGLATVAAAASSTTISCTNAMSGTTETWNRRLEMANATQQLDLDALMARLNATGMLRGASNLRTWDAMMAVLNVTTPPPGVLLV